MIKQTQTRKEQIIEFYETRLKQMLSNDDLKRLLKDCKILEYKDLKNYNSLYDLLSKNIDYAIILIEFKQNQGHWCCLTRNNNNFYWFDSYGVKPDGELKFINSFMRKLLGENNYDLTKLIKQTITQGGTFGYNKKKYQVLTDGINTCGKWVYIFIKLFLLDHNPSEFRTIMKQLKENNPEKPYDILICEYI